jgi:hypothetical protein
LTGNRLKFGSINNDSSDTIAADIGTKEELQAVPNYRGFIIDLQTASTLTAVAIRIMDFQIHMPGNLTASAELEAYLPGYLPDNGAEFFFIIAIFR